MNRQTQKQQLIESTVVNIQVLLVQVINLKIIAIKVLQQIKAVQRNKKVSAISYHILLLLYYHFLLFDETFLKQNILF